MKKIEYIDFAKGYAIFTIMLFHMLQHAGLSPLLNQAIIFGGSGVHLFFLLSGFGLGLSRREFNAIDFYKRRAVKIWLPYVLILTISLGFAYGMNLFNDRLSGYLAGVFLYQMFDEKYITSFGGHFWFISAIIQFYLFYPFFVWVKKQASGKLWVFVGFFALLSLLWWIFVFVEQLGAYRIWNSFFLQFAWEFALGMALAEAYKSPPSVPPKGGDRMTQLLPFGGAGGGFWAYFPWWAYLPIGLAFTGIMVLMILKMGDIGKIFNDVPTLIGYTALSIFLYHIGDKFLPFIKRFFLWVATFSYSLYLVHLLVLVLYLQIFEHLDLPINAATLLPFVPLALFVGWAFEPLSQWWVRTVSGLMFGGQKKPQKTMSVEAK